MILPLLLGCTLSPTPVETPPPPLIEEGLVELPEVVIHTSGPPSGPFDPVTVDRITVNGTAVPREQVLATVVDHRGGWGPGSPEEAAVRTVQAFVRTWDLAVETRVLGSPTDYCPQVGPPTVTVTTLQGTQVVLSQRTLYQDRGNHRWTCTLDQEAWRLDTGAWVALPGEMDPPMGSR